MHHNKHAFWAHLLQQAQFMQMHEVWLPARQLQHKLRLTWCVLLAGDLAGKLLLLLHGAVLGLGGLCWGGGPAHAGLLLLHAVCVDQHIAYVQEVLAC